MSVERRHLRAELDAVADALEPDKIRTLCYVAARLQQGQGFYRQLELSREELRGLLDACDPARSPAASRAYEKLLDIEHAGAEVAIIVPAEKGGGSR